MASACGAASVDEGQAAREASTAASDNEAPRSDAAADGAQPTEAESQGAGATEAESQGAGAVPALVVPELVDEFGTLSGASVDLASLQGEDVVLWFWAPW